MKKGDKLKICLTSIYFLITNYKFIFDEPIFVEQYFQFVNNPVFKYGRKDNQLIVCGGIKIFKLQTKIEETFKDKNKPMHCRLKPLLDIYPHVLCIVDVVH